VGAGRILRGHAEDAAWLNQRLTPPCRLDDTGVRRAQRTRECRNPAELEEHLGFEADGQRAHCSRYTSGPEFLPGQLAGGLAAANHGGGVRGRGDCCRGAVRGQRFVALTRVEGLLVVVCAGSRVRRVRGVAGQIVEPTSSGARRSSVISARATTS
jgi:hypothetical protein